MIKNLGTLSGRLLVFGGPYSNLQATAAILAKARALAVPASNIICTGDLTAYCGNPSETTELVRKAGIHVIQGNCEESLAADTNDCGCGYQGEAECARLSDAWYNFSKIATPQNLKTWMGSLPLRLEFTLAGKRFHVLHGSAETINQFIFPSTPSSQKAEEIIKTGADIVIAGHSGLPFTQLIGDKSWHNPGVIGLPANDGTSRVWYSTIYQRENALCFEHHALDYDHASAAEVMRDHGLNDYAKTLETGIYPTFDSLADKEKQIAGIPLMEQIIELENHLLPA